MNDQAPQEPQHSEDPRAPDPRRRALLVLVAALLLIVLGLILLRVLGNAGRLQDCVMSGRTNSE